MFPRKAIIIVLLTLAASTHLTYKSTDGSTLPEVTLRGDLPPIRATYNDVLLLSKEVKELIERAAPINTDKKERVDKTLTYQIASKNARLATKSLESIISGTRLPNPATRFRISRQSYKDEAISNIDISLGARSSEYELSGTDTVTLESLKSRIENFGEEHRTHLGGPMIGFGVFMLLMLIGVILVYAPPQTKTSAGKAIGTMFAGTCLLAIAMYMLITDRISDWFPTTAIYTGSSSVLERYSPEFTFWGLVVGILGIIITIALIQKPPKSENGV